MAAHFGSNRGDDEIAWRLEPDRCGFRHKEEPVPTTTEDAQRHKEAGVPSGEPKDKTLVTALRKRGALPKSTGTKVVV